MTHPANLVEDESWRCPRGYEYAIAMESKSAFWNPRREIDQTQQLHGIGRRDEIAGENDGFLYFKTTGMVGGPCADG